MLFRQPRAGLFYYQKENAYVHGGSSPGYQCTMIYSENEKITISACVNSNASVTNFGLELLEALYPYRVQYTSTNPTH